MSSALRPTPRFVRLALVVGAALCVVALARAHTPLLSQSAFEWEEPLTVRGTLVFPWQDAVRLDEWLARRARSGDGGARRAFEVVITAGVVVEADGTRCPGRLEDAHPFEGDAFAFVGSFRCARRPERLRVSVPLLGALPAEHRHLLRLSSGANATQRTLSASEDSVELSLAAQAAVTAKGADLSRPRSRAALEAMPLGIRHILTGWDHLLFLLGLALGAPRARAVIVPISAFTVAHSLTLAAAGLGLFALSPRVVEPAIALSIAYVAFENLLHGDPPHRSAVTFAFGLVHGFGFAGALRDLALDAERLVPTLLGFNVGVELGQLAAVGIALCLVLPLRRAEGAARALNVALGITGLALCGIRLSGP